MKKHLALCNQMQYEKVLEVFADSRKNKHRFVHGDPEPKESNGYFINPTIIDNPPSDSVIWKEEPFGGYLDKSDCTQADNRTGPIVPVQPWRDEADVIRRCNDDQTGLGACVYSKDIERAERIAQNIDSG